MKDSEIRFGQKVQCRVTKFVGIVEAINYHLHMAKRATIQSQVTAEGKMGEGYDIDVCNLTVLEEPDYSVEEVAAKYALGSKVECMITGITGTITGQRIMINGCVSYDVLRRPRDPAAGKPEELRALRFMEAALRLVEPPKEEATPKSTGCSHSKAERY